MSGLDLVLVAYDQTNTQGVADSVVKYLRRDHGYEVVVVGPGHGSELPDLPLGLTRRVRFFLELDAVSGLLYHSEGLDRLSCPKLAWFVDSHKKPHFHQRIAEDFDLVFFTMWAWGGLFGERGRWLPVHYDPEWIGPRQVTPTFDVGFVGSRPVERTQALQEIVRRHGFSLLLETTTGPREKELTAELYGKCRIVFNQHVANDLNFRMVEGPACRRLLLTDAQRNGQYELFSDREHVAYYKDDQDLEHLLVHYLRHPEERERIAAAGYSLVSQLHTTPERVNALVAAAEGLVRARGGASRARGGSISRSLASTPPQAGLLVIAGEEEVQDQGPASSVAVELAGHLDPVDLLVLSPPREELPRVHLHVAPAPRLPRLATSPEARALLENAALLDAASELTRARGVPYAGVVALRPEHGVTALSIGRPFVLLVGPGIRLEQYLTEFRAAARLLATEAGVRESLLRLAPDLESRIEVTPPKLGTTGLGQTLAQLAREVLLAPTQHVPARRSPRAADTKYDHEYMLRYGYCTRSPQELRLKEVQAGLIARVLAPQRVLVAGCAAGELLLPFLARGVDAWGFDAAQGLERFVYPEVRDRVLAFDVTEVGGFPWDRAGGRFDTLVAIDLFEHVDEERVDLMLEGISASFERLALVISSSPDFEGHVCVKPFPWWLERLERWGFEILPEPVELLPGEQGTYGVKRYCGVQPDMSEQLVFLRKRVAVRTPNPSPPPQVFRVDSPRPRRERTPDVSICVVCCNRPGVLEATLETTRASLVAMPHTVEWLAFDNGSSEPVRQILEDAALDVVLRAGRNLGLAPALDALYGAARGRYVLTLEDDWACASVTHGWLELAVRILDTQPDVGVVRLRRMDDGQCGHFKHHRPEVALRHHPWSVEPFPSEVVETRTLDGERYYVAGAEWVNWTHNPTLCRREVRDWIGPLVSYLPDPRDHRPRDGHPGLEGAIDRRWRSGRWKVAKLLDGPFTHIGDQPARVEAS